MDDHLETIRENAEHAGDQHRALVLALAQSIYTYLDKGEAVGMLSDPQTLCIEIDGTVRCTELAEAILADIDARVKAQVS